MQKTTETLSRIAGSRPAAIELKNVSKHFGGTLVLEPFTLELEAGCRTVLLGPSGCGKTTLLRMIAGLETPDKGGRIIIGGEDVTDMPAEKRRIGFMFQQYALFPHMTVEQNIVYGLKVRGESKEKIDKAAARMLDLVGLEKFRRRSVLALSGGQRQRVALARALAVRPKVLLLDEPLSALDAQIRRKVREELAVILKELGITAVIVTHDQDEAMMLGDRIVVMEGGRIHQAASPREVWERPQTPFVAGFVGGSNRTDAKLVEKDGVLCIEWFGRATPMADLSEESQLRIRSAKKNDPLHLFFRANDVKLSAPDGQGIPSVVKDLHFMGNFVRASLAGGAFEHSESAEREGRLFKADLDALPEGLSSLSSGDSVRLKIDPKKLMVFTARNREAHEDPRTAS